MASEATDILDLNDLDNKISSALNNNYLNLGLGLFLILYAAVIAPKLSSKKTFIKIINHWLIKLLLFFIIVYVSSKNSILGIIILIAVMSTLLVSEKTAIVYVDQSRFNNKQWGKNQQIIETKNQDQIQDQDQYQDQDQDQNNFSSVETELDISIPNLNLQVIDSEVNDVHGLVDESLDTSSLDSDSDSEIENNYHPMDQGAMTSLGRSIKSPTINESDDYYSYDSYDNSESENIKLHNSVEQVTAEIEQEQGSKIPDNTKQTVFGQLRQKFNNMSLRDSKIPNENELLQVCRDVYRSIML